MITTFRFVEQAEVELDEAATYYGAEPSVGLAFTEEIDRVLGLAMRFPRSGTLVPQKRVRRDIRLFRLNPDFPYDIVATTIDEKDLLLVLAVAHQSRRPKYWISRLSEAKP